MKSIAVTKPDMGVLSRERLPLSPFGALAQSFAEELLARAGREEGNWPFVPLELLEEGDTPQPSGTASPGMTFQVDLQLVLEVLRREGDATEQQKAAQRIVERILLRQARQEQPKTSPETRTEKMQQVLYQYLSRSFTQNLTQNITRNFSWSLLQNVHMPLASSRQQDTPAQGAPGGLAQQVKEFSRQLQIVREEGKSFPAEPDEQEGAVQLQKPVRVDVNAPHMPQEELPLLQDAAVSGSGGLDAQAVRQAGEQLQKMLGDFLEERTRQAESSTVPPQQASPAQEQPAPVELSHREEAAAGQASQGEAARTGTQPPAARSDAGKAENRTACRPKAAEMPVARDIRVGAERYAHAAPEPQASVAQEQPAPVELSHREETAAGQASQGEAARTGAQPPAARSDAGQAENRTASRPKAAEMPVARDIRVGAYQRTAQTGRQPGSSLAVGWDARQASGIETGTAGLALQPPEMVLNQPAGLEGMPAAAEGRSQSVSRQHGDGRQPDPLLLAYGPSFAQAAGMLQQGNIPAPQQQEESEYVRSLPDWARQFLKRSGTDAQPSHTMGVAQEIVSLPPQGMGDTVQWTAPNYHPPQAPITYREKGGQEPAQQSREVPISDAQIQKAADRVYQLITERIRRERRRFGL